MNLIPWKVDDIFPSPAEMDILVNQFESKRSPSLCIDPASIDTENLPAAAALEASDYIRKRKSRASSLLQICISLEPLTEINVLLFLLVSGQSSSFRQIIQITVCFSLCCCMSCVRRIYRTERDKSSWNEFSPAAVWVLHRVRCIFMSVEENRRGKKRHTSERERDWGRQRGDLNTLCFSLLCGFSLLHWIWTPRCHTVCQHDGSSMWAEMSTVSSLHFIFIQGVQSSLMLTNSHRAPLNSLHREGKAINPLTTQHEERKFGVILSVNSRLLNPSINIIHLEVCTGRLLESSRG